MDDSDRLFVQFCDALNAELLALGCGLRVAPRGSDFQPSMMLVDAGETEIGWVPDHVDAVSIAAFERILIQDRLPSAGQPRIRPTCSPHVKS